MFGNLKNKKGFTMIELLMVFLVLGILAQMAWTFMIDLRKRSFDLTALVDGRNLLTVVRNSFVTLEDIKYTAISGNLMGIKTTGDVDRAPAIILSPGVRARVTDGSASTGVPDTSFFEAYLYHENGSPDSVSDSGKREFYYIADETVDPPEYSSPPSF